MEDYFRVNSYKTWSPNVQYAIVFQRDRLLFLKIGGQFADYSELSLRNFSIDLGIGILPLIPMAIFGILLPIVWPGTDFYTPMSIGMFIGLLLGTIITRKLHNKVNLDRARTLLERTQRIIEAGTLLVSDYDLVCMDKQNFQIPFDTITELEIQQAKNSIKRGKRIGQLDIYAQKHYNFDIAPNQDYSECQSLLERNLSGKISSGKIQIQF
jgi:hypothetical protein